jgi:hypothetical protein
MEGSKMGLEPRVLSIELAILSRIIAPKDGDLSAPAARAWLKMKFPVHDRKRAHELALKAQEGALTTEEEREVESYRRIGRLLDLMHSKARLSLKEKA